MDCTPELIVCVVKFELRKIIPWLPLILFISLKLRIFWPHEAWVEVTFHFRASCTWISKTSCPVRSPVDFLWDPAVTATVTASLCHSFYSAPTALGAEFPLPTVLQDCLWPSPCQLSSAPHACFYPFASVSLLIFSPFLKCMSASPSWEHCPGCYFCLKLFPTLIFLSSIHSPVSD